MTLPLFPLLATLVQETPADPGAAPPSGGLGSFPFVIIIVIAIFYVVLILPERKKQKQRTAMLGAMKKGDKVMTSAGIYGTIAQLQEDVVTLQVSDGVRIRFNRAAIQTVLTDGNTTDEKPTDPDTSGAA